MRETLDMFQVIQKVCCSKDLPGILKEELDTRVDFDYYRVVYMGGSIESAVAFLETRGGDPEDFAVVHFPVVEDTDAERTDDEE